MVGLLFVEILHDGGILKLKPYSNSFIFLKNLLNRSVFFVKPYTSENGCLL